MRALVIINPVAGAAKRQPLIRRMIRGLRSAGIETQVRVTAYAGEAGRIAAEAAGIRERGAEGRPAAETRRDPEEKPPAGRVSSLLTGSGKDPDPRLVVIAVGGDGTLREVADGLSGGTIPLVVWPAGTENLLAKSFGFRAKPELVLACLRAGRCVPMDLGVANGHTFLTVAGVGFDAEVVARLVRLRTGHITHLSYVDPIWRTFWEHRFPSLRVIADGETIWEGRGLAFVGNSPRYSLGLRVIRDARTDDGLLDVCIFPCRNRTRLIAHSIRTLLKRHVERGGVVYRRARRIRIESPDRVPVELDGEMAGHLPLDIEIRPRALYLQLPPA
jgi:diacylglycerol kinase family enzyme